MQSWRSRVAAVGLWGLLAVLIQSRVEAQCRDITLPLTEREDQFARIAWSYFVNNWQPATGFTNSADQYPSGTLWDMGNYLTAMNAAWALGIIEQDELDFRLNLFLQGLNSLQLFEGTLPNKVYNTIDGTLSDYNANPMERGLGWSALDLGRILAALHIMRTCHPQYAEWIGSIVGAWNLEASVIDGDLYGATVLDTGETLLVQEGRLGYEEYAARGYQLWGFTVDRALAWEPFDRVTVEGVEIPVDQRNFQNSNGNNYVVSESFILDAIEFGLGGDLAEYAGRVLHIQEQRYQSTGQLTAVSEDNVDVAPNFLYSTVFANDKPWAVITENNEDFPELRAISTKAAIGWHYLYPEDPYARQIFEAVVPLGVPNRGFMSGLFEATGEPNTILTGNTNGLILEILYYKARDHQPILADAAVNFAAGHLEPEYAGRYSMLAASDASLPAIPAAPIPAAPIPVTPLAAASTPSISALPSSLANTDSVGLSAPAPTTVAAPTSGLLSVVAPPVSTAPAHVAAPAQATVATLPAAQPELRPERPQALPLRDLSSRQQAQAAVAWAYFEANYAPETGLVRDREDVEAATPWGLGSYLMALQAAHELAVIDAATFESRTRQLLNQLHRLPLADNQLPFRGYDVQTLTPVDYGNNPNRSSGWSSLDASRLLSSLHRLKARYPSYHDSIDQIVLRWNFEAAVQDGELYSASTAGIQPETRLGYQSYALQGFGLWGFALDAAPMPAIADVEGFGVPTHTFTVSNPYLLQALEFGFDRQLYAHLSSIFDAQAARYERTGQLTAAATTLNSEAPFIVHSSVVANGEPWRAIDEQGSPTERIVSTGAAFSFAALFPEDPYSQQLNQAFATAFEAGRGFYEGLREESAEPVRAFSNATNSLVLQSLLYAGEPLIPPLARGDSAWWQAIASEPGVRGRPTTAQPQVVWERGERPHWRLLGSQSSGTSLELQQP